MRLLIQDHLLQLAVYLLRVSSANLVLGDAWFAMLGPHGLDYNALTLKFYLDGNFITLNGDKYNFPLLLSTIVYAEYLELVLLQNYTHYSWTYLLLTRIIGCGFLGI